LSEAKLTYAFWIYLQIKNVHCNFKFCWNNKIY